jgi:hypothetical protein
MTPSNLLTAVVSFGTPTSTPIIASVACGRVKIFQLSGLQVEFVVTDVNNPNSPITIKKGHSYTFSAGYTPGSTVGSFVVLAPPVNNEPYAVGSLDRANYLTVGGASGADATGPWAFALDQQ